MKPLLIFFIVINSLHFAFGQKLSVSEAIQDFEIFKTTLKEAHPGIYRYESKATIDALFEQTKEKLNDSVNQQQFYRILSPLVALLHCGHTEFYPQNTDDDNHPYYYETEHLFPLKLYFLDKKAFYIDSYDKNMDFEKGTEIISINGNLVNELITVLFKNIVADGRVVSSKYMDLNDVFPAYYANLIESSKEFNLVLKNDDGVIFKKTISSTSLVKIREYRESNAHIPDATFSLSFPKKQLALMTIKHFYSVHKKDNFKSFLKKSFNKIHAKDTKQLIIDLRNNGGGNDRWGPMLFSYITDQSYSYYESLKIPTKTFSYKQYIELPRFYGLLKLLIRKDTAGAFKWTKHRNLRIQKPQKRPFMGEVIVLVNGFSFSVTSEFAAIAKASNRVKIVGQETGGAYAGNNSGSNVKLTLPNSLLTIEIPMIGYYMDVTSIQPHDRGVLPNREITTTIQDIISGEDFTLERVLEEK